MSNCRVCGSEGNLRRCSKCKTAYYCSQVHQQSDWRVHKIECKKFSHNTSSTNNLQCVFQNQFLRILKPFLRYSKTIFQSREYSENLFYLYWLGHLFDSLAYQDNDHISIWANINPTSSQSPSLSESGHDGYLSENSSDVSHYLSETNSYFAKDEEESEKSQRHFSTLSDNTMQICDDSLLNSHLLAR